MALTAAQEWEAAADPEVVQAVVDLSDHLAGALAPFNASTPHLYTFRDGSPNVFLLASEVVRQARLWVQGEGVFQEARSGYQSAVSNPEVPPKQKAKAKAKRPTSIAMMDLMSSLSGKPAAYSGRASGIRRAKPPALQRAYPQFFLRTSQCRTVPKSVAAALSAAPPVTLQPSATVAQPDFDAWREVLETESCPEKGCSRSPR